MEVLDKGLTVGDTEVLVRTARAGIVVSGADLKRTFGKLLAGVNEVSDLARRVERLRSDVAPLKMHLAIDELPEFEALPDLAARRRA